MSKVYGAQSLYTNLRTRNGDDTGIIDVSDEHGEILLSLTLAAADQLADALGLRVYWARNDTL